MGTAIWNQLNCTVEFGDEMEFRVHNWKQAKIIARHMGAGRLTDFLNQWDEDVYTA